MIGLLGLAYLAIGYFCFWKALRQIKPGVPYGMAFMPLLAIVVGPPIMLYTLARMVVNPSYRPTHVTFIEIEVDPKTGELTVEGEYETVWQSQRDREARQTGLTH